MLRFACFVVIPAVAAVVCVGMPARAVAATPPPAEQSLMPTPKEWMKQIMDLPADNVRDALDDEDRPKADRSLDATQGIEAVLRASGIARDMRVLDLRAGDGYLAQVLARAVRRLGRVWAVNDPATMDAATAKAWDKRLEEPSTADIARIDSPLGSPIPGYATPVDIVFSRSAYHVAVARGIDRNAMNAAAFAALSPGGKYVIVDARAADGAGPADAGRLCRTTEALVRSEAEAAGFRLVQSSDALHQPKDSAASSACAGDSEAKPVDRLLMIFQKPAS